MVQVKRAGNASADRCAQLASRQPHVNCGTRECKTLTSISAVASGVNASCAHTAQVHPPPGGGGGVWLCCQDRGSSHQVLWAFGGALGPMQPDTALSKDLAKGSGAFWPTGTPAPPRSRGSLQVCPRLPMATYVFNKSALYALSRRLVSGSKSFVGSLSWRFVPFPWPFSVSATRACTFCAKTFGSSIIES